MNKSATECGYAMLGRVGQLPERPFVGRCVGPTHVEIALSKNSSAETRFHPTVPPGHSTHHPTLCTRDGSQCRASARRCANRNPAPAHPGSRGAGQDAEGPTILNSSVSVSRLTGLTK